MRPIWDGTLSFLLVDIPVSLYTAISRTEMHFRLLHKETGTPIEYRKYCPACGKEVDWDEIVKGYEYEKGKFVVLTDEDFEAADPKLTRAIEILDFVKLDEIPPAYYDRPYYLAPKARAAKTYHLFAAALREEGKVGIAKVVIKTREYLAAIIPQAQGLLLETLYFEHEINRMEELSIPPAAEPAAKELKLARQIVGGLTAKFDPGKYTDEYRRKLLAIIKEKAAGRKIEVEKGKVRRREVESVLAALQDSVKEIKKEKAAA